MFPTNVFGIIFLFAMLHLSNGFVSIVGIYFFDFLRVVYFITIFLIFLSSRKVRGSFGERHANQFLLPVFGPSFLVAVR